jgi:two-component system, chemotaxis family, sensor kinase CheA
VAAERGVADPDAIAAMDDEAVVDLIFAPGFSTARAVTGLSGRGVGMDAVRTAIQRMGGRVTVASRAGQGTTVRFAVPFTLMMSAVMTVEAGGQVFGVPLDAVAETIRIPRSRISPVGQARAFVLRGRTIPLIDLAEGVGASSKEAGAGDANVVVASVGGQLGGLEVDRLGDRMDVMLKPMDGLLAGMPGVAGTTLLGDGRVLIVLDLEALLT